MQILKVIDFLKERLKKPLPGVEAQLQMVPVTKIPRDFQPDVSKVRTGGVLIYLYPDKASRTHILLMKRPVYKGVHSGQVSFPGGKQEKTDKDFIETALREFKEETGIEQKKENIIGTLSELYIPASNFIIYPVVSYALSYTEPNPDPTEVEYLIEMPLEDLLDSKYRTTKRITPSSGIVLDAPCFAVCNEIIWGATAMVLSEFVEIFRDFD